MDSAAWRDVGDLPRPGTTFAPRSSIDAGRFEQVGNQIIGLVEHGVAAGVHVGRCVEPCAPKPVGEEFTLVEIADDPIVQQPEFLQILTNRAVGVSLCEPAVPGPGVFE